MGVQGASIRPRPLRRGDAGYVVLGRTYPARFNSAAPSQARRRPSRPGSMSARACFNSAAPSQARRPGVERPGSDDLPASIRPRPLRRGDSAYTCWPFDSWMMLQFGRALSGAETCLARPHRGDRHDASIRPRPLRRGDWDSSRRGGGRGGGFNSAAPSQARRPRAPGEVVGLSGELQFGRALSGAETPVDGFRVLFVYELQFGRALSGAETPPRLGATALPVAASIRPRPLRRGDGVWRQLGRVWVMRFNSAAPSQARRRATCDKCEFRTPASIRPRPLRRGDSGRRWRYRPDPRGASIRPRPLRRGDSRTTSRRTPAGRRFNSAAPSQARRPKRRPPQAAPVDPLQFGRALSGAETVRPFTRVPRPAG